MGSERTDDSSPLERLRQPEYTGENRCVPCTAVNVAIAVVVAAVVAVVSLPVAAVAFVLSLATIYVRGYLVPGTPTLTKRYFPDWLLAKFDKAPEARSSPDPVPEHVDPEQQFLEHGIVAPCDELGDGPEDDLCLADAVREEWRAELEALRDGNRRRQVTEFLEIESDDLELDRGEDRVVVRVDGRMAARWESEPAMLADLAGVRVLADRIPGWERLELQDRSQLASGLRAFVESCPGCRGPISLDEETVESCCRSHQVYAITCEDCNARILEVSA